MVLDAAQQIHGTVPTGWVAACWRLWPSAVHDGMFEGLVALMRAGGVWTSEFSDQSDAPWGAPGSRVRAVRLGQRVVLVWRRGA